MRGALWCRVRSLGIGVQLAVRGIVLPTVLTGALLTGAPLVSAATLRAQDGPSLVILVRHAEKASQTERDPSLSEIGQSRAVALSQALTHMAPNAIIVTSFKRTAETAAPTAAKFGITPTVVPIAGSSASHVAAVAEAVRKQRGVVLVVGHSNTVTAIAKALGGPSLPDICDASYATMYVLEPAAGGSAVKLLTAQFGAADAVGATACAGMAPR